MKKILGILTVGICLSIHSSALALNIGVNPAGPSANYDLGGGQFATLVGVQDLVGNNLVGQTITLANLNAEINSGTVSGWYYGAGNGASAMFSNISQFAPFVSDTVVAGTGNAGRIWDSLYIIHAANVVFDNSNGGSTTAGIGGNRITGQNPFRSVPDAGSTLALMGVALAGLGSLRRKIAS